MEFIKHHLYHIYNQGNNKQSIFFSKKNYLFFVKKMKTYIMPYADVLAWCLMPNHFHLMVCVNHEGLPIQDFTSIETQNSETNKQRTFNQSIGILLRSYTRAINKQENRSGSLFRKETKAKCITCQNGYTPNYFNKQFGTAINLNLPEKQYPQVCFDYIHQNPVVAGLVNTIEDWEFSSAKDYYGERNGSLINKKVAKTFIDY